MKVNLGILIFISFMEILNFFPGRNDITLELNQLDIREGNDSLVFILNKISSYEQSKYGKSDVLLYDFLISRTAESKRESMDNYESIYITGIDNEWPMPTRALSNIMGYIEIGNVVFIVSDGGGFTKNNFSSIFIKRNNKKSFTLLEYKEKNILEEDDSVIRIWCHFLYKNGQFKIFKTSCYCNNGLIDLF